MKIISLYGFFCAFISLLLLCILLPANIYADVNTALLEAVNKGDVAGVKELIGKGADVNATCDSSEVYVKAYGKGTTVLMMSAINGSPEIVNLLLEKGARIDAKNEIGMTALAFAEKNGRGEIPRILTAVTPAMADDRKLAKRIEKLNSCFKG